MKGWTRFEDADAFRRMVERMLAAQKRYFRARKAGTDRETCQELLRASITLEGEVRRELDRIFVPTLPTTLEDDLESARAIVAGAKDDDYLAGTPVRAGLEKAEVLLADVCRRFRRT